MTYNLTTGQVRSLSSPGGVAQTITYNGELPATTTWDGPVVKGTVEPWYDEALRPSGVLAGGQMLASIFYSRDGLPTNIGSLVLGYRQDNALLESVSAGSASTTFAYDSLGQVLLAATVNDVSGDTVFRQGFTYDRLGRVVGLAERIKADTVTYAYGYDPAGRLAEVRTGAVVTAAYSYDLNGNRTRVVTPSQTVTAAYDAQDRLLSAGSATYVHAATGERTMKIVGTDTTRTRYSYGNLRDVYLPDGTHVQYVVDAQQRRTARLVNGVVTNRWLYQSQLAIAAEVDSAGTPVRTFNYGSHENVPELMTLADGTQYRLVTDHLGSVRLVIDVAADTVVQRLAYDAYGRVIVDTKPGFQPFGYAGGLYDPLTGLVRFGARDYDAEAGRWTAADPIGLAAGTNQFEYASSTPAYIVDPSGLWPDLDDAVNFSAGVGDALIFGFGDDLRRMFGIDGVNQCSTAYRAGGWTVAGIGAARLGYAVAARGIAALASSGASASNMRVQLRNAGRLGMGRTWRQPDLTRYASDASLRAAAGRTNPFVNAYGLALLAFGTQAGLGCGCR